MKEQRTEIAIHLSQSGQSEVRVFENAQFGQVRTALSQSNEPLFCLADVCSILGLQTNKVKQRINPRGWNTIPTPTNNQHGAVVVQEMTYIDEPNLYRCIFQSRKKEAEKFQDWVFEDVLPSIRQNGGYIATTAEDSPEEIMAKALIVANATIAKKSEQLAQAHATIATQSEQIKADAPKVVFADALIGSRSSCLIGELAKVITQSKHFFTPILA